MKEGEVALKCEKYLVDRLRSAMPICAQKMIRIYVKSLRCSSFANNFIVDFTLLKFK